METISPSILYAIGASLCAGLYAFTAKIATEHLKDSHSFVFYALCGALVLGTFGFFYHIDTFVFSWAQIGTAIIVGIIDMSAFMCIMHALKHVSSSLFFINYRVISSLLLLLTGVLFFGEELSAYNLLGFALGFIVFFLLYENEKSEKKEKDIRTGMLYLGGAIVLAGLGHTIFKCISSEVDIYSFYFFRGLTAGICISLFLFVFQKKRVQVPSVGVVILALIHAVLFTSYYVYFLQKAYAFGYLSISYKILSYSIFIPIILSIIFYKEKLTLKRVLAFILTVISVLFFMY